jgi:hypothetical protein
VEPTAALYVPSKNRVYVLLGNLDLSRFIKVSGASGLLCTEMHPTIIAINPVTNEIVSLGGTAPGGGIALGGYNPPEGTSLAYDSASDRLLVLSGGCNAVSDDGGLGPMTRRQIEEVNLGTGAVKTLVSLDDKDFPSSLALASAANAAVSFGYYGAHWDPRMTTLGDPIDNLDLVVSDGRGAFVGTHQNYDPDGGATQILAVPVTDAGPTVITENPFTKPGGYVAGLEAFGH